MNFRPEFEGRIEIADMPEDILQRVAGRVEEGLFVRGSRLRANYAVIEQDEAHLRFTAQDRWTAINVGLNDVTIRRGGAAALTYFVTYWQWLKMCLMVGGAVAAAVLGAVLFTPDLLRRAWAEAPWVIALIGVNMAFWCFAWPWLLAAMHRRPAARCLESILLEEAGAAPEAVEAQRVTEWRSPVTLYGLPLIHVRWGSGSARGIIAIGSVAQGAVAIGVQAVGGVAIGVLALGGVAIGVIAVGGVAIGTIALGGISLDAQQGGFGG